MGFNTCWVLNSCKHTLSLSILHDCFCRKNDPPLSCITQDSFTVGDIGNLKFCISVVEVLICLSKCTLKINDILTNTVNPLHPNIIHTLHTVLYIFFKVLIGRICKTIKSFVNCWSFPLFSGLIHLTQGRDCKEKIEPCHF